MIKGVAENLINRVGKQTKLIIMKKKSFNTKLKLAKIVISNLNELKGGRGSEFTDMEMVKDLFTCRGEGCGPSPSYTC